MRIFFFDQWPKLSRPFVMLLLLPLSNFARKPQARLCPSESLPSIMLC
jgi:hypothetical protein